jgi:SAM-dependent methyltransferase
MPPDRSVRARRPWEPLWHLPPGTRSLLDVGCNEGATLCTAGEHGVRTLRGIEINRHILDAARGRLAQHPDAQLFHGSAESIPLSDESMDAATCLEVLEHVPAERRPRVIREVSRVLVAGGRFIVTVPAKGLFRALDPANVRYRVPALFRFASAQAGGGGRDAGYAGEAHGVVWHHHFTKTELVGLLDPYFELERLRWRGALLTPLCGLLQFPFYRRNRLDHPVFKLLQRINQWDHSLDPGEFLAYNVLMVFRKR